LTLIHSMLNSIWSKTKYLLWQVHHNSENVIEYYELSRGVHLVSCLCWETYIYFHHRLQLEFGPWLSFISFQLMATIQPQIRTRAKENIMTTMVQNFLPSYRNKPSFSPLFHKNLCLSKVKLFSLK